MPDREAEDRARWSAVLDELWRHARDAVDGGDVADGGESVGAWEPPAGLGALPEELRPRAESILTSQAIAAARVGDRLADVSARLRALKKIPQPSAGETPVYLDRVG